MRVVAANRSQVQQPPAVGQPVGLAAEGRPALPDLGRTSTGKDGSQRGIPPAADYRPDRNALERLNAIKGIVRVVIGAVAAENAHQVL